MDLLRARRVSSQPRQVVILTPDACMMADFLTKVTDKTKYYLCRAYVLHG